MKSLSRTLLPALAVLALAGAALPARAQSIRSPFRYIDETQGLQFFGGYLSPSTSITLDDSTEAKMGPGGAPLFGVRYQLRFSGPLSGTLSAAYSPAKRRVFLAEPISDSTSIRPIDTGADANSPILLVETGLLFNLTGPRAYRGLAPFVGVNVGYAREVGKRDANEKDVPEGERYDFGPSFALAALAGTDVFVTRRVSIRAELDGRLWKDSPPAGFRNRNQAKASEWNPAPSAQIGAVFHF